MTSQFDEVTPAASASGLSGFAKGARCAPRLRRTSERGGDACERRELKLRRLGFRVIGVSAELVLTDVAAAVALVRAAL